MTNGKKEPLAEKWLRILKNNPVVATLIIISLTIVGIAGVYESLTDLGTIFPTTYESQFNKIVKLIDSDDPDKEIRGISLLKKLAENDSLHRQDLVTYLQTHLIKEFPQDKEIDEKYLPVLREAIQTITTLPRFDANNHQLNIDIHQIRIEHLDLTNTNFSGVSLWGNQFIDVNFSRSDFRNADLGGTQFKDCWLEYAKFEDAKITGSFMDKENGAPRPTRFINTHLYGSTIDKAQLDFCELINITDYPVDKLRNCITR
jgi:hypothetical protein